MDNQLYQTIQGYENYIQRKGVDESVIDAYTQASQVALMQDDTKYGLQVSKRAKQLIEGLVIDKTGGTVYDLDSYCRRNQTEATILNQYYELLLAESPYLFNSYLLYLEKKREEQAAFYLPKMKQLNKHGLIQTMQDMEYGKYDRVCLSMPPGTQKCQPLYSKVLTPNGFIEMKNVTVGTKVISGFGNIATVITTSTVRMHHVYEIILENGAKCRCSDNHLWEVRDKETYTMKTVEFTEILDRPSQYMIPIVDGMDMYFSKTYKQYVSNKEFRCEPIRSIEYIGKELCKCIYIDDPCHLYITDDYIVTHNTTLEKFFCSWIIGKYPEDYSLFFSHNSDITEKFYKGVLDITTDNEYTWQTIFPKVKLESTNAKAQEINFGKYKPYASIQCSSIGSKNAGKVRTNRYLYCDDLIGSIEEALNPRTLDKIWGIYGVDLKQRKLNEQVKELIIMTRWSTKDVVGRIIELYGDSEKTKIIAIPDIDPKTGQSNFDYKYNGMSVAFFQDQALTMDEVSYKCLYKQEPIEREGLLFPDNKIRRYTSLPTTQIKRITGQADCKGKGTDFFVLPCLVEFEGYEGDFYCVDALCNKSADYEFQYEKASELIVNNEMQDCEFESNMGGDRVGEEVDKRVKEKGWICNITSVPTESNKEARIFQCSNWILQHIVFKDKSLYSAQEDYGVMMSELMRYSVSGKNYNDDVPDVFSNFSLKIQTSRRVKKARVVKSPI